ncbi:MAG TPA: SUF system Fe-S cluster assembly regulator [Candidatus Sulfotelmatobacter sp.]
MIRLGKLTDYGVVLMTFMARDGSAVLRTSRDLAVESKLPLPTVSKVLKKLLENGLLTSHRGIKGGYSLAKKADQISVADIVVAIEGPIALTECSDLDRSCEVEHSCPIKNNQRIVSDVVRGALEKVTISDLLHPLQLVAIRNTRGQLVPSFEIISGSMQ